MYAFKIVIFALALLVAVASSRPVKHRRRGRSCHAPTVSSAALDTEPSDVVVPSPASNPSLTKDVESKPTAKTADKPESTSKTATADEPKSTKDSSSSSSSSSSSGSSGSSSSSSTSTSTGHSLFAKLFPADNSGSSWSTSDAVSDALPLADSTFRPFKAISALSHKYVQKDGKDSMQAHYPEGSYTFGHQPEGGISFYAPGPSDVDLTDAKEATFGYSVFFPEGFDFNKGGKLPGLYGGDSDDDAVSCSGGRRSESCFSTRLMWREDGAGELYTYLPMDGSFSVNKKQCDVKPFSECNPTYGASVGRGSFKFATGQWTTVSQRVRLNDAGQSNGEMELFANGKSVVSVSGLKFRSGSDGKIRGIQMQTFFGGHDSSYASPKDQDVFFSDFSAAIIDKL